MSWRSSNLALDSKLRGCDLVRLRVRDVAHGEQVLSRTNVIQQKTAQPVRFELTERTREVTLELGEVRQLRVFPEEPYQIDRGPDGKVLRDRDGLARHRETRAGLQAEIKRRLAQAPKREVLVYIHGFNETFATAAYTAAELCHFLAEKRGRPRGEQGG